MSDKKGLYFTTTGKMNQSNRYIMDDQDENNTTALEETGGIPFSNTQSGALHGQGYLSKILSTDEESLNGK